MNWLWSNKEWIFSGIGVAIPGVLYALFFTKRSQPSIVSADADRQSSVLGTPMATGSNIRESTIATPMGSVGAQPVATHDEKPTPAEIVTQLNSLPLFQREDARRSYYGLRVCWPVRLLDLQKFSEIERQMRGTSATHRVI